MFGGDIFHIQNVQGDIYYGGQIFLYMAGENNRGQKIIFMVGGTGQEEVVNSILVKILQVGGAEG